MKHVEIKEEQKVRFSDKNLADAYGVILKDLGLKCKVEKDVLGSHSVVIEPQILTIGNQDNILYSFLVDRFVPMFIEYR